MSEVNGKDNDIGHVQSTNTVLTELTNIQFIIDVKMRELEQFRTLRRDDFTLNEIRMLEEKLIKHFGRQLDIKRQVISSQQSSDLQLYPSLSKLLTVAGISSLLAESLEKQNASVENLLQLSDAEISSIIADSNGHSDDSKKLLSTINSLKKCRRDSSVKSTKVLQPIPINNRVRLESSTSEFANGIDCSSKNHSRSTSGSFSVLLSEENSLPAKANSASLSPSPFGDIPGDVSPRNRHFPSTNSSSPTPPTLRSSQNALDDSAFAVREPKLSTGSLFSIPSITSTSTIQTPPVTPGTPHRNPNSISHSSSANDFISSSKNPSRTRVGSTGAKSVHSTLMPPFSKLKSSKSSEWVGNTMSSSDSLLTPSNYNQSSTLPHSASKHGSAKPKKHKKRPGNIVIDDSNVPNYITFHTRQGNRRGSTTVMGENPYYPHTSPLSPRTPMTPVTPCKLDMLAKDREISSSFQTVPHTPKTPKNFNPLKKILKMGKRMTRHKSTEILDDNIDLHSHNRAPSRRSSDSRRVEVTQQTNMPVKHDRRDSVPLLRRDSAAEVDRNIATELVDGPSRDNEKVKLPTSTDDELTEDNKNPVSESGDTSENSVSNLFRQASMMNSEEWDIPYDELKFTEKIGCGRVGTVHRGYWHGDVAIRVIDVSHNDEEKLKAFKQKIMIYKKTRHENLELFMGSCMKPPHLAIVTDFCRGQSLYNYIRNSKNHSISVNYAKIIAQHIAQGMGYLHSKGIIHKDLKSKNVFVDGKRVFITDFGLVGLHAVLFNTTSRAKSNELVIPDGWLCYLAPEVIRALRCPRTETDDVISTLPYTVKSDVFAFGTIWYELLSGFWPFKDFPAESVIYQVGSGKKQNLSQLQGGKDTKDLLTQCWSLSPSNRPDFSNNGIMGILKNLQSQILRTLSTQPRRGGVNRGHERLFEANPHSHSPFNTLLESTESKISEEMTSIVKSSLPRMNARHRLLSKHHPDNIVVTLTSSIHL